MGKQLPITRTASIRATASRLEYLKWDTILSVEDQSIVAQFENPAEWVSMRKTFVCGVSILTTFMAAYSISAYVAGVSAMAEEFRSTKEVVLVGMTTFQTGFAVGPMLLAPLSEINGRKTIFLATYFLFNGEQDHWNLIFITLIVGVGTLIVALINNLPGLLVVRFFQGIGASTFSSMVGGIIADLYEPSNRGLPMSLFATASFSAGLGQLVSGFILKANGWRWIHWHQLIINAFLMAIVAIVFKETRGPVVLSWRAKALNKATFSISPGREDVSEPKIEWRVKEDEQRATLREMLLTSVTRPFNMLLHEPVVFWFSMWISFSWAVMFLFFESVPLIFSTSYHFTQQQTGLVLVCMFIGAVIGNFINPVQERFYRLYAKRMPAIPGLRSVGRVRKNNTDEHVVVFNPEARLYLACMLSLLMSVGLFMYGWTSFPSVPWIFPAIAIIIVTIGAYTIYLSVFNYFADVYTSYASSAMAAQSFCRNTLAGSFPLLVDLMFTRMTFQGASSFLGGVGLLLSAVPLVLVMFGPNIRARSKLTKL